MEKKKLKVSGIILFIVWFLWCLLGSLWNFTLPVYIIVACVLFVPAAYILVKAWAVGKLSLIAMLMILVYGLGFVITNGMDIHGIKIPLYVRIVLFMILIAGNVVLIVSFVHKRTKEQNKDIP